MKIALFIPCYVDQFYPDVAIAALKLLEKLDVEVIYPLNQTCCGQPMANSGFEDFSKGCDALFVKNFACYDYIVSPSGSCVLHIKEHLHHKIDEETEKRIRSSIYELTEFITDILGLKK